MTRVSGWRQACPTPVRALQELALLKPLFLLRQSGPTAFIVQEDEAKPVQVRLGDPHTCGCRLYQRTKDLCLHICWVLLKKLQLKHYNPLSFQLGLVARELADLLEPRGAVRAAPRRPRARGTQEQAVTVPKRNVQPDDVCPICLLQFEDSRLPVVYCRHGCGNGVHTRCMVQVARHQLDCEDLATDRLLTCPLCRGPFCKGSELADAARRRPQQARPRDLSPVGSHDVTCVFCRARPVVGNLYRCLQCPQVLMCAKCVTCAEFRDLHQRHGYAIKKDKWQTVRPPNWDPPETKASSQPAPRQIKTEVGIDARDRHCAYCGLPFRESEQWAGKWQDLLLHMSCVDHWRADPFRACSLSSRKAAANCGLPMIDLSSLLGPPEVRVVRLSLSTRPQEAKGAAAELPRAPRPPRQAHSPLRLRPRRARKKKSQKTSTDETDGNKLPVSVTLGRALGARVQPLMAILMSPRVRSSSLHSDDSGEEEEDEEAKTSPQSRTPLLSITSLELPELPPARPACQPVRRVRTSVRRTRPPLPCAQNNTHAQNITCSGSALTGKK